MVGLNVVYKVVLRKLQCVRGVVDLMLAPTHLNWGEQITVGSSSLCLFFLLSDMACQMNSPLQKKTFWFNFESDHIECQCIA